MADLRAATPVAGSPPPLTRVGGGAADVPQRAPDGEATAAEAYSTKYGAQLLTGQAKLWRTIAALLYAWFVTSIPWFEWRPRKFKDVYAYVNRIDYLRAGGSTDFEYMEQTEFLFSEPLWTQILKLLGEIDADSRTALLLISFVTIFVFALFLFVRTSPWLCALLLFNPMFLELTISQVRSAFAAAVCLVGLMTQRRSVMVFAAIASCFIHSITFMFIAVYLTAQFVARRRERHSRTWLAALVLTVAIAFACTFAMGHTAMLAALGDRRALIVHVTGDTPAYCAYWFMLAVALLATMRARHLSWAWEDYYASTMLSVPLFMSFFSLAAARLVPLTFPLIVESMVSRPNAHRTYLVLTLVAYQFLHFSYWLAV